METLSLIGNAFAGMMNPMSILLLIVGVAVGIVFGSIPGLSAAMAVALFLPVTFAMQAHEAFTLLVALYIGGISGGLISAILINIPGTSSSIATCFDGSPMAKRVRRARLWVPEWYSPSWAACSPSWCLCSWPLPWRRLP